MFFNKKKSGNITTKVTKSSLREKYEKVIKEEAYEQTKVCPECGALNPVNPIGFRRGLDTNGFWGKCNKCGAEWETLYKY